MRHASAEVDTDTLDHGLNAFGYLVRVGECLTGNQFASRIAASYDAAGNARVAAVVYEFRKE